MQAVVIVGGRAGVHAEAVVVARAGLDALGDLDVEQGAEQFVDAGDIGGVVVPLGDGPSVLALFEGDGRRRRT